MAPTQLVRSLRKDYYKLVDENENIGKRYKVTEIETILYAIQDGRFKIGELEKILSDEFNRNQIKYLLTKLLEDTIISTEGIGKGTRYFLSGLYVNLRGGALIKKVLGVLRKSILDFGFKKFP